MDRPLQDASEFRSQIPSGDTPMSQVATPSVIPVYHETKLTAKPFIDRRISDLPNRTGIERRQFSNTHDDLSAPARELALAIDQYKLRHRRRFINYEEMLSIVQELGYRK